MSLRTALTELLGCQHPVMLAGMNTISMSDLAAAVSNAGGVGCLGGATMTPKALRQELDWVAEAMGSDKPIGIDLLLPQVGGNARKTNYDYTHGHLPELIDIMVERKVKFFVSAVGVPPAWAVEKLHAGGVLVANMVGSVRNAQKALDAGADILIAQGTEAGGHTGDIGTMVLIPQVVDVAKGRNNFQGTPVVVVAAGGFYDGRGLAAALALGASGVWVGTRFICAEESHAPKSHKDRVIAAGSSDTIRTVAITGRPLRLVPNNWVKSWEAQPQRMKELCDNGITPHRHDLDNNSKDRAVILGAFDAINTFAGQASGGVKAVEPAKKIVEDMVQGAVEVLTATSGFVSKL